MIDELDNRVRNMEYINSQEFICDLLRTVDYSKDEIDENKRIDDSAVSVPSVAV